MRNIYGILRILSIIVLFSVCAEGADWEGLSEQIRYPVKRITKIYDGDMFIDGRWSNTVAKFPSPILPRINATKIWCYKRQKICKEFVAVLFTPEDTKGISNPFFSILEFEYKILDWSDDVIRAKHKGPVADIELKVSVKDEFAERTFGETKAGGVETSDPNSFYVWTLE
jgi:hypothetical protein